MENVEWLDSREVKFSAVLSLGQVTGIIELVCSIIRKLIDLMEYEGYN